MCHCNQAPYTFRCHYNRSLAFITLHKDKGQLGILESVTVCNKLLIVSRVTVQFMSRSSLFSLLCKATLKIPILVEINRSELSLRELVTRLPF